MNRFEMALARFDEANAQDASVQTVEGNEVPKELFFARELTRWVLKLNPEASEVLQLAARSQHICRWQVPRASFPMDRPGYHRWKNHLKQFHAEIAGRILREIGYDEETIRQVQALNLKKNFPHDPDSQTLEDALCLVFLERQFGALAQRSDPAKMVNALQKSWAKMSAKGRAEALKLPYSAAELSLIQQALA